MIFRSKTISSIGLDISDLGIKFVQLYKKGNKVKIQSFGQVSLNEDIIVDGEIKNSEEVLKSISTLLSKPSYGSVVGNDVVACLPETKTFIKLLEIDDSPNQIEDVIPSEIEKHIPFLTNKLYFDWQRIKNKNNKNYVLVGAVEKTIAEQYISLLNKAKLSISALEVESAAICRSLLQEESSKYLGVYNKNYCLIDIGAKRSSMVIYSKNTIVTTISMPISGNEITKRIAKTLQIDQAQAEKAKIICGLDKAKAKGIVSEILSDMTKKLIRKIKSSIDFYYEHYPHHGDIDNIILCGGGANINNLDKLIKDTTSIETLVINPLENIDDLPELFNKNLLKKSDSKAKKELATQNSSFSYTTAIGLALRNITQ